MSKGNIPLYQQGKLTPQATATVGKSNAGAAVQNVANDLLEATHREVLAENAKIKIADNMEAEKHKIQWENEVFNSIEKQKQDKANLDNPYGLADKTYETVSTTASQYANTIANPRAREMFLQKSTNTVGQAQDSMRKWASDQTATNAFVHVQESVIQLGMQAGKVKDKAGYLGVLSQGEAMISNAAPVIGIENALKLRESLRKEVAGNYIYSQIDSAPGTIKAQIQGGMFDKELDAKEKYSYLNAADAIIDRNAREQKAASAVSVHLDTLGYRMAEQDGSLTLGDVDKAIATARRSGVREADINKLVTIRGRLLKGEKKEAAAEDRAEATTLILNDLDYIISKKKDGKVTTTVSKETTLHKLQRSQDILDDNREYLTKASADKYQKLINSGWEKYVSKNKYVKKKDVEGLKWTEKVFHGRDPADDFSRGLSGLQTKIDKTYVSKSDRDHVKRLAIQNYNKYYSQRSTLPGFNNDKFVDRIYIEATRRAKQGY